MWCRSRRRPNRRRLGTTTRSSAKSRPRTRRCRSRAAPASSSRNNRPQRVPGPLSHIKVLDLSRVMAGPWAGQLLADLGADVIKVERPGVGDDTRSWGPPFLPASDGKPPRESGYYLSVNRGKRSITLDLDKPEGQNLVRAIAARSDIVLENFKAGALKRFGL